MATEEVKSTTELPPPPAKDEPSKAIVAAVNEKSKNAPQTVHEKADALSKEIVVAHSLALANVKKEKSLSFIKAWEESEKTKLGNKAEKKLSSVDSWESIKTAEIENKLRRFEESLEKKKATFAEKMKNQAALIHKQAEENRATIVAARDEELLKLEELRNKYCALGALPKKPFIRLPWLK